MLAALLLAQTAEGIAAIHHFVAFAVDDEMPQQVIVGLLCAFLFVCKHWAVIVPGSSSRNGCSSVAGQTGPARTGRWLDAGTAVLCSRSRCLFPTAAAFPGSAASIAGHRSPDRLGSRVLVMRTQLMRRRR